MCWEMTLLSAPVVCPAALCAECYVYPTALPSIPIPGGKSIAPPAFTLAGAVHRTGTHSPSQVTFAVLPQGGKLHGYEATLAEDGRTWSLKRDSIALSPEAEQVSKLLRFQVITRFLDPFGTSAAADSGYMVAGTGGMLESVHWRNGAFAGVSRLDIFGETITAIGEESLGGASGWVYQLGGDTGPSRVARPFTVPVRQIDASGALGDSGWVAVNENGGWSGFKTHHEGYRGFRFSYDAAGLSVDTWPGSGTSVRRLLRDAQTDISGKSGGLDLHRDSDPPVNRYFGPFGNVVNQMKVSDPDGNFMAPSFDWIGPGEDTIPLAANAFKRTDPKGGCEAPGICLQADAREFALILKPDSVVVEMKVQASIHMMCGGFWAEKRDSLIRMARPWKVGDKFRVGPKTADGITFLYDQGMAIANGGGEGGIRFPAVLERSRGLAAWPEGLHPDRSARAVVYGGDGMRLGDFGPGERLLLFPSGLAFVVWPGSKGKTAATRILLR
jgi:hypothetical protein